VGGAGVGAMRDTVAMVIVRAVEEPQLRYQRFRPRLRKLSYRPCRLVERHRRSSKHYCLRERERRYRPRGTHRL
jgi:hypothetical protein